jgi:hypothetical protein
MTESEIQCFKDNIDKTVEIETIEGERLIAKVISVFHSDEYDEHEFFYEVVSSNMLDSYSHLENSGGYALDFEKILSVKPHSDFGSPKP